MHDPFHITGPAVISFSGGRTSGYMLHRILESHSGVLPSDVKVVFCNTGKERAETLDFVERCSQEWGVPIIWLEYRYSEGPTFMIVDYHSANRKGKPFEAAIQARCGESGYLPNPRVRYCTIELKIKTLIRYLLTLGWTQWTNAIGFRYDEPQRVSKLFAADIRDRREDAEVPLYKAGITKKDVMKFWAGNHFDLQLGQDESNCDLCFLKGAPKLQRLMRERPESAEWWIEQEKRQGTTFRNDRPRYEVLQQLSQRPQIPGLEDEPDELSIACHCTD